MDSSKNKGKYLKIVCPRCYLSQTIFGKASSMIKCMKCNRLLAKTTGGKAKILAKVTKVL